MPVCAIERKIVEYSLVIHLECHNSTAITAFYLPNDSYKKVSKKTHENYFLLATDI